MKIAVSQINTTIGDFEGNGQKIIAAIEKAERSGVDLIVFPELTITGYPPKDLLERPVFISKNLECIKLIAKRCKKIAAIVGYVSENKSATGKGLYNSAALFNRGKIEFVQHKALLPTYDVFDEARYFEPGTLHNVFKFKGTKMGITICEDVWSKVPIEGRRLYRYDPVETLVKKGAKLIINISASPFHVGKGEIRRKLLTQAAKRNNVPIIYVNSVGGNDDLIFDGRSVVINRKGEIAKVGHLFKEDFFIIDTESLDKNEAGFFKPDIEEIYEALVLGLSDYIKKCGFKKVVIGLSGGIDSCIVASVAVAAIGAENVYGIAMPSPYSSKSSVTDAKALADNLGIKFDIIPIGNIYESYLKTLAADKNTITLTEENIQARIRGNILMAISNKTSAIVLSTGNKSELAVGYCTLYGDMAGGLAVISDVPKTAIYELARHINRKKELIPSSSITKPPSAELRPDQKDSDSLPSYEVLDPILKFYIEDHESPQKIIARGFDKKVVEDVIKLVDRNEYKRRQAAPGLKVTSKAFGVGRREPIVRKF